MGKKKSKSLPSTPADKSKVKPLPKTPLVKFMEEPKIDTESDDSDFNPSDVSEGEKIELSEDEINQELSELADEATEFEMMKQYEKMFNDEEAEKEKMKGTKKNKNVESESMEVDNNDDGDEEDDDDYKPVYEEQSEDDDWANQDMANEAIALMNDNEKYEKAQISKKGAEEDDDDEEDDDYKPVYEEQSEDDDWANQDMANEAIALMNDNEQFEKKQKINGKMASDSEEEDEAEDDEDEEMMLDDEDDDSEAEQKLDGEEDDDEELSAADHQAQLKKLIREDPDFAKFIEEEDKDLLEFGDEEEEEEVEAEKKTVITPEMVKAACKVFENPKSSKAELRQHARFAVKAFSACMVRVSPDVPPSNYVINQDKVFDSIIRMCYTHLAHVLLLILDPIGEVKKEEDVDDDISELLKVNSKKKTATKGNIRYKYWKEFNPLAKEYLRNLTLFLMEATSTSIMICTLRAIIDNAGIFTSFEKLTKNLIRILIRTWSRKIHDCRCLAFVGLSKLIRLDPTLYPTIYKGCYVAYVACTRSISVASIPLVSFMQKSFAELTFLQPTIAYQYTFVYIRQCAIHLRNATIAKRKDLIKTIYNWQYIECLYLWTHVLSNLSKQRVMAQEGSRLLRDLIHPLTQIICGTMKAFNAHRYVPLKAHCIRMLLQLQKNCNIYIPTLAYSAELLNDLLKIDSGKPKKGKGTVKSHEMKELIKFNTDAMEEVGYRGKLAEEIRSLIVEAAYLLRHNIGYADVYTPVAEQFRKFLKVYKNREQSILFKKVFTVLKGHFEKVELLINAREMDIQSFANLDDFAKAIDGVTSDLNKCYVALKKAEATGEEEKNDENGDAKDGKKKFEKMKKNKKQHMKKKFLKKKVIA
uniref:Nucleolar complex protein 2 homolog n=1 Tax=Panagrolaimus superbus TaxID=310955 RepID=A0A914YE79_9BILA